MWKTIISKEKKNHRTNFEYMHYNKISYNIFLSLYSKHVLQTNVIISNSQEISMNS
jgi:hypothetical protein